VYLDKKALVQVEKELNKLNQASGNISNMTITEINRRIASVYARNIHSHVTLKLYADIYFNSFFKLENIGQIETIDFGFKDIGIQMGNIMTIQYYSTDHSATEKPKCHSLKYYLKTHSNGLTKSCDISKSSMDFREMLIYKFFQFIKLGPEVHFFFNQLDCRDFYIATKYLGIDYFTMPELVLSFKEKERKFLNEIYKNDEYYDYNNDLSFKNKLDQFTVEFKKDNDLIKGLILLDMISKLLNLQDLTTKGENYGFMKCNSSNQLIIVDFLLQPDVKNQDYNVFENFIDSQSDINKTSYIPLFQFINENKDLKKAQARDIISNELKDFGCCINKANDLTLKFIDDNKQKLFKNDEYETMKAAINIYVRNVLNNFDDFVAKLNKA
jgi:hypothetical protein